MRTYQIYLEEMSWNCYMVLAQDLIPDIQLPILLFPATGTTETIHISNEGLTAMTASGIFKNFISGVTKLAPEAPPCPSS